MNKISKKVNSWLENPLVDTIAKTIKKFKSSKSYWSVSSLILIFTLREAIAWKYGSAIKTFMEAQAKDSSMAWFWDILGFVFDVGGSWELVALGTVLFLVLSLVKVSESESSSVSIKENSLTFFLLVAVLFISLYNVKESGINQTATTTGSNNTIKQEINIDNDTKKLCKESIETYQKSIKELSDELAHAQMIESTKIIGRDLEKTKTDLKSFQKNCN